MKKSKKKNKFELFIIVIVFIGVFILSFLLGNFINKNLKRYSTIEVKKFLSNIVNSVVNSAIYSEENTKDIFIENTNGNKVISVDVDDKVVNRVLSNIVNKVEDSLINIENGNISNLKLPEGITYSKYNKLKKGIIVDVPTGSLFGNALFANLGPRIPVKMSLLGNVVGNIDFEASDYGINNTLLKVYLVLEINEQVVLPITTEEIKYKTKILIASKLIQGEIPTYIPTYTK